MPATPLLRPSRPAPPGLERRAAVRFAVLLRCVASPKVGGDGWRCIAYDISSSGIGVALPMLLPRGTALVVKAWDTPGAPELVARVARATPVEGAWFTGCELVTPLTERDLAAWTGLALGDKRQPEA